MPPSDTDLKKPGTIEYLATEWPGAKLLGWSRPGWYFWDESGDHCDGPYDSHRAAARAMRCYADSL